MAKKQYKLYETSSKHIFLITNFKFVLSWTDLLLYNDKGDFGFKDT